MDKIIDSTTEETAIAEYIIDQVIKKGSGELESFCNYNKPSDVYFIGNFRPTPKDAEAINQEILQKLSPSAFGAEFLLEDKEEEIVCEVDFKWSCYYRVFPTYEEQRKWVEERQIKIESPPLEKSKTVREEDSLPDITPLPNYAKRQKERKANEDLFVKFNKKDGKSTGKIRMKKDHGVWTYDVAELKANIRKEFERITAEIFSDPSRIKTTSTGRKIRPSDDDLSSEEAYRSFVKGFTEEINYSWDWDIIIRLIGGRLDQTHLNALIQFVNVSEHDLQNPSFEPFLFNPKADITFLSGRVFPFELELAPKNFRYNRYMYGRGFNCGINVTDESSQRFSTTHAPIYKQKRYKTKEEPEAPFSKLSTDPIPVLRQIYNAMNSAKSDWTNQEEVYRQNYGESWAEIYQEQFNEDFESFKSEVDRFKVGLELIESDSELRLAFELTNKVFETAGLRNDPSKAKTKWRLFQIVFLLTQIPSVAALNTKYNSLLKEREIVDIIYFPTGGGKTEAYLSVLVFNAFYDRMRGKKAGVTSWIRFPLRLLTVQQTQRLTDIIGTAELIRTEISISNSLLKGSPFTVGYFVGKGSTPNRITNGKNWEDQQNWSIAHDPVHRQKWKRVISCPSCRTNNVVVEFDDEKMKLLHVCKEPTCKFPKGVLPIYIVDEEVYRYLPTVVVGTIDKLAGIGNQRLFSMIFGKVEGYCKKHGYFNSECIRKWDNTCGNGIVPGVIDGLTGPMLFIQDELHLLKEGLGTFDSHYETFSQYLLKEHSGEIPLKIIASSATIEEYKRQINHLYGRKEARMFPGLGPTLLESFYAKTYDHPQRIFIGILPHNKTIFNAVLEIIEAYHGVIHELKSIPKSSPNPYNGQILPRTTSWESFVDKYRTSLTYFLAGRELDSTKTDIEHYINPKFNGQSITSLTVKELTGGVSTDEVTETLSLLERQHIISEPEEAVLATSMVSHGVDVDRLNSMIFYGMPRQNAEYIQASSRVGRSHVGIVFTCLHPIRERDQSHFAYFTKYHEFIGQLVEPVAINRWSTYSINRTLPGLFMAALLQVIANNAPKEVRWTYDRLKDLGKLFSTGKIDENMFKEILMQGYQVDVVGEPKDSLFERRINELVPHYVGSIKRGSSIHTYVSQVLSPTPMTSLRDVDVQIPFVLESGSEWVRKKGGKK